MLFLLFDLEILLVYPYVVSSYNNSYYGAWFVILFLVLLTVGFIFEMAKKSLELNSKQSGYLVSSHIEVNLSKDKLNLYKNRPSKGIRSDSTVCNPAHPDLPTSSQQEQLVRII